MHSLCESQLRAFGSNVSFIKLKSLPYIWMVRSKRFRDLSRFLLPLTLNFRNLYFYQNEWYKVVINPHFWIYMDTFKRESWLNYDHQNLQYSVRQRGAVAQSLKFEVSVWSLSETLGMIWRFLVIWLVSCLREANQIVGN